jgi:hypothetical protein
MRITPFAEHAHHAIRRACAARHSPSMRITPFAKHAHHAIRQACASRHSPSMRIAPFAEHARYALPCGIAGFDWRHAPRESRHRSDAGRP